MDKSEIKGSFGTAPAGAPHEVATGGAPTDVGFVDRDGIVRSAAELAQANEVELPAYAPTPMTDEQMAGFLGKSVDEIRMMRYEAGSTFSTAGRSAGTAATTAAAAPRVQLPVDQPIPGTTGNPLPPPLGTIVGPDGQPITSSKKPADVPLKKAPRGLHQPKTGKVIAAPVAPVAPATDIPVESIAEPIVESADAAGAAANPAAAAVAVSIFEANANTPAQDLAATARQALARPAADPDAPYRPAQSDTESPSRGLPTAVADPGKTITGGFGDMGEAQYFPLDGTELGVAIIHLLENMIERIKDDLRFSIAVTYPRVHAKVLVEVDGFVHDQSFNIQKLLPPHDKTPAAVARAHGDDEVVFVLVNQVQEMTEDGESLAPPNAIRAEIGLPIPQKRWIVSPSGGKQLVDVVSE